jgi:phage terminase large subunit-like protein
MPEWSTACPDWEDRIVAGDSLIQFDPLFPEEAAKALDIFCNDLHLVDVPGRPTMGEVCRQWVLDFVSAIFGAYDHGAGRRLIRYFFLLISKKNSKSTIAAGIMLTALIRNWRDEGEFYILAPTKEVADNSYKPAAAMVRANPILNALFKVQDNYRTITHIKTKAFLKVVSADNETVSGKKTIGLLVDELWLFGKRANADNMIREAMGGLASRPEGFVIYLSTQSDEPPTGVFEQRLKRFRDIRDGKITDRRSLPVIYEFPEAMVDDEAYDDPANYYITNPNLGASVDQNYLDEQRAEAEADGRRAVAGFLAKHLNVQIGMNLRADSWAGALVWERGLEVGLGLNELLARSEVVTIGIDGGGLDDLLGVGVIGREKGTKRWLGWAHALISDIGIERRKANIEYYNQFEREHTLTKFRYVAPTEDVPVVLPENIQFVVDLVQKVRDLGLLAQVGVDAAGIGAIVDALAELGVTQDAETLDAVRQGIALMGAIKTIEIKLADYSFRHGESAMLKWCVGNLRVIPTRTAMMVARDEAGFGKVDPAMALFNAAHLMSLNPEANGLSVFDRMGDEPQANVEGALSNAEEAAILNNPTHPKWQEVRDAWERRNLSQELEDAY